MEINYLKHHGKYYVILETYPSLFSQVYEKHFFRHLFILPGQGEDHLK